MPKITKTQTADGGSQVVSGTETVSKNRPSTAVIHLQRSKSWYSADRVLDVATITSGRRNGCAISGVAICLSATVRGIASPDTFGYLLAERHGAAASCAQSDASESKVSKPGSSRGEPVEQGVHHGYHHQRQRR